MMSLIFLLNLIMVAGAVFAAGLAVWLDDLLSAVVAVTSAGVLVAMEFILLSAPDVALAEVAVGAVLSAIIFAVGLQKIREVKADGGEEK